MLFLCFFKEIPVLRVYMIYSFFSRQNRRRILEASIYFVKVLLFAIIVLVCIGYADTEIASVESRQDPRIAMFGFTALDVRYDMIDAAASLSDIVQAAVMVQADDWDWVERQELALLEAELQLGVHGIGNRGSASMLALGQWLHADVAITGTLIRDRDQQLSLQIEAIDLTRADVLASRDVSLHAKAPEQRWHSVADNSYVSRLIDPGMVVSLTHVDAALATEALLKVLQAARAQLEWRRGRRTVAPLFLFNISAERRLDFLESDFLSLLYERSAEAGIHILRFPRSGTALEESHLVVSGMVSDKPPRWHNVADLYVWGEFTERETYAARFEDVTIEVKLHIWNGHEDPIVKTFEGTIGHVDDLFDDLVNSTLAWIHSDSARPERVEQGRLRVAKTLYDRVAVLEKRGFSDESLRMLEAACFFSPERVDWRVELLQARERQLWGSKEGRMASFQVSQDILRQFLLLERQYGSAAVKHSRFYHEIMKRLLSMHRRHPLGAPASDMHAWRRYLEEEYVRRLTVARHPDAISTGAIFLEHSDLFVDLVEELLDVWMSGEYDRYRGPPDLLERIKKHYERAGQKERGIEIVSLPRADFQRRSAGNILRSVRRPTVPRLDLFPPPLDASMRAIPSPVMSQLPTRTVSAILPHESSVWISVQSDTQVGGGGALDGTDKRDTYRGNRVLLYDMQSLRYADVTDDIGVASRAFHMHAAGGDVWLASVSEGVWRMSPCLRSVQQYGYADGLLTRDIFAVTDWRGQIFVGGGTRMPPVGRGTGRLSALDLAGSDSWAGIEIADDDTPPLTFLETFGDTLLVCAGSRHHILLRAGVESQTNLTTLLFSDYRGYSEASSLDLDGRVLATASDAEGYWIGTWGGLFRFCPASMEVVRFACPPGVDVHFAPPYTSFGRDRRSGRIKSAYWPASRIPGGVSALLDDGDFLWVATMPVTRGRFTVSANDKHYVLLFHKPTQRWVGRFEVGARVSALASVGDDLWIGLSLPDGQLKETPDPRRSVLLAVSKQEIKAIPETDWVSDQVSEAEILEAIASLSRQDQAVYHFLLGNDELAVQLLEDAPLEYDALFMLAYAHDQSGLDAPEIAIDYFRKLMDWFPESNIAREARRQIQRLQ